MSVINNCSRNLQMKSTPCRRKYATDMSNTTTKSQIKSNETKTRSRKKNTEVIHEFFIGLKDRALELEDDTWAEIFGRAACNDFPKGIKYVKNTLSFKVRMKNKELYLSESIEIAYKEVKDFIQSNTNILTDSDIKERQIRIRELHDLQPVKRLTWKDLAKTSKEIIRIESHIINFAKTFGTCLNFDSVKTRQIVNKIKLMNCCGKNTLSNFHLEEDTLVHVDGIEYDEELGEWTTTRIKMPKINVSDNDSETCSIHSENGSGANNWSKWLQKFKRSMNSEAKTLRITQTRSSTR